MQVFIVLKILSIFWVPKIYFIKSVMQQGIYFYMGAYVSDDNHSKKTPLSYLLILLYIIIALIVYSEKSIMNKYVLEIVYIILAIIGVIMCINIIKTIKKSKLFDSFKQYTFQIFLMHTIFAAGVRIIMFKFGIYNYFVHLIIGLTFSIYMPVLVSIISNKLKYTNFFFYPIKTIEEYKKG